jgi:hypothetical protein
MKKIKTLAVLFLFGLKVFAQTLIPTTISFIPSFGNSTSICFDSLYSNSIGTSFKFETLKFYISNFQLLNGKQIVYSEENSFHLVDFSDSSSLSIMLNPSKNLKYTHIRFNLGIDSLTNVSGAYGGDLDPTKGMYWTWQSGYINFKLEGVCSVCPTAKKEFQFHIGGYLSPYNTLKEITLKVSHKNKTEVILDLKNLLDELDLMTRNHIMSPNKEAVLFSEILVKSFHAK